MTPKTLSARADAILDHWFGPLDDDALLHPDAEPFATHYRRWYGKDPAVDADIRERFEGDLLAVSADGRNWDATIQAWGAHPRGLLALTLLLDQTPRNMYRGTPRMYRWDALGLMASEAAHILMDVDALPLVQQMFLRVPLLHVEDLTVQERALGYFEELAVAAKTKSPQNVKFFGYALDSARRHLKVIEEYERFPHRNVILGRTSTPQELELLKDDAAHF